MAFELTYKDYLKYTPATISTGGGDAGFSQTANPNLISEERWNSMTNAEKYTALMHPVTGSQDDIKTPFLAEANAEDTAAFRARFGDNNFSVKGADGRTQSAFPDQTGLIYGYGALPTRSNGKDGINQWAIDPSRVLYLPDGRWVMEANNVSGSYVAQEQATSNRVFNQGIYRNIAQLGTAALGGYLVGGAAGAAGGSSALESGGILTGADIAGGTSGAGYIGGAAGGAATGGTALGNSIVGDDPAYPGTGNPNYAGPGAGSGAGGEPAFQGPSGADEPVPGGANPGDPGFQGPSGPDEVTGNYAPVNDLSTTRPWYQPLLDKFSTPAGISSLLGTLPGVAGALKPLAGSKAPTGGMNTMNSLTGNRATGQAPKAAPFQSAENSILKLPGNDMPIKALGEYLRGT